MTLRSESHAARIERSSPLYQCRLCPSPRKVKQAEFLVVAFSEAGREHGFFGVLPELICNRHGTYSACPESRRQLANTAGDNLIKSAHSLIIGAARRPRSAQHLGNAGSFRRNQQKLRLTEG